MTPAKWMFAALLFASPAFAQNAPSQEAAAKPLGAPGCGPADAQFAVKTKATQQSIPAPASGKAMIVFLQDDEKFESRPRPTTRFGVDGAWVGATHANSFFYLEVDPGERHLCASWQSLVTSPGTPIRPTAASHFTAESGQTYYFRAEDITRSDYSGKISTITRADVELQPLDSDEAQVLMSSFEFSTSHVKK